MLTCVNITFTTMQEDVADQQLLHTLPDITQRDNAQLAQLLEVRQSPTPSCFPSLSQHNQQALATHTQQLQEALEAFAGQALHELHAQAPRSTAGDVALLLSIGNVFVQRYGCEINSVVIPSVCDVYTMDSQYAPIHARPPTQGWCNARCATSVAARDMG